MLLSLLLASSSGCDRRASTAPEPPTKLRIVTSVYPLAALARDIAGPHADVEWFCENGQDPRNLKLSTDQKSHAHNADLILTSGFPEPWAGENMNDKQRALRLIQPDATAANHGARDNPGALWLDPPIAREVAELIRDRLTMLDAKHENDYRQASVKLLAEIDAVDTDFRARLAPYQGRRFLALRPTWASMAARYGLEEVAPIDTDAQRLTDDEVRKLRNTAREEGIELLAVDAALLPGVRREIERRTGLRVFMLDTLGSSAPDARSTWPRILRYNLEQLENAMKE